MLQRLILFSTLVWISMAAPPDCEFQKVVILDNVYTMTTIRTFIGRTPTAVFYLDRIEYELEGSIFTYEYSGNTDKKLDKKVPPKPLALYMESNIGMTLRTAAQQKVATLNGSSTDKIIFKKSDDMVLLIRYPFDDNQMKFGKLYAFNETDVTIIGQFVVTHWIKELGDKVADTAVNPITGDIIVSAKDSNNNGALILLKKVNVDPCPNDKCVEKVIDLKSDVSRMLQKVEDKIMNSIEDSLKDINPKSEKNIQEYEDRIMQLNNYNEQLIKSLQESLEMFNEFQEQNAGNSMANNNLDVSMRQKRNANINNASMCIPRHKLIKQRDSIKEAASISRKMKTIIVKLEQNFDRNRIEPRYYNVNTNSTHISLP